MERAKSLQEKHKVVEYCKRYETEIINLELIKRRIAKGFKSDAKAEFLNGAQQNLLN